MEVREEAVSVIIHFNFNRKMKSQSVTIEPETIQLGREVTQTLKIMNNSAQSIPHFFFCLYNTEKFSFSPDSFSLAPREHKLITVSLRINSSRAVAKEFAYLKAADINKRITLVINQFASPDPKQRSPEEGLEDINTLSSREYRDVQTHAIEKIIREKEAYIGMLEREKAEGSREQPNFRTEESGQKSGLQRREIQQLEMKVALVQNQRQSLLKENALLAGKFEEYRKMCEADLGSFQKVSQNYAEKVSENNRLIQEVNELQRQGSHFLATISDKEALIRELEAAHSKNLDDQKQEAHRRLSALEDRLEQQRLTYQQSTTCAEQRVKDLERQLEVSKGLRMEAENERKEVDRLRSEMGRLREEVEKGREVVMQLEEERKRALKLQVSFENINERNNDLSARVRELQQVNHNLREEVFVCKSKLVDQDTSSDKMNQYLQIALQSCRNENEALKRTKAELEKSLDEVMSVNRQSHDAGRSMADQASRWKEEVRVLGEIKDGLERRNEELKQEHHLAQMQLKTENIELLERLSLGQNGKRQETIIRLEEELVRMRQEVQKEKREVERIRAEGEELRQKNQQLVVDNTKLSQRVKKYKKEAKKELRTINDTAINQLAREQEEKQRLAERIQELEDVILNYSCDKAREDRQMGTTGLHRSRSSSRAIGIKDQRKEIQYSQSSNNDVYGELGELRQVLSFVRNEEERFVKQFGLQQDCENHEGRPILQVIRFFKRLEVRLGGEKDGQLLSSLKEAEFLRGRIKELEAVREEKENLSSLTLGKTRDHCSQLLEFIREQMKSQHKKLSEAVKLSEQRFELLKKKIYDEYRTRVIENLNKKDKHSIGQLETLLERFIEGMGNLSHKEAVLQKESRLKQAARKQNAQLKGKVTELNYLLQERKGACSRDPLRVVYNEMEVEWQESLKREAEMLTLSAENNRMKEELQLCEEELSESRQQKRGLEKEVAEKSSEILRLKKCQLELQSNYEAEIQRQYAIIEDNKKRIVEMGKSKQPKHHREKDQGHLKDSFERQKEVIRQLREKEKVFEELLEETHRNQERDRKKQQEEARVVESMRDLKESNRQLRGENGRLKERLAKLEEDLQKKTLYMKNLKGDLDENRIRVQKKEQAQNDLLRQENKKFSKDLEKLREQLQKLRKRREKQIAELKNEADRLRNENIITEKSLESVIRALMESLRKVFGRLRRLLKKKGRQIEDTSKVFENVEGLKVNALLIDEALQKVLAAIDSQ